MMIWSSILSMAAVFSVPLAWYPRLLNATAAERRNCSLLGDGYAIEWPDLDEHIGVEGLLAGRTNHSEIWLALRLLRRLRVSWPAVVAVDHLQLVDQVFSAKEASREAAGVEGLLATPPKRPGRRGLPRPG
ncbi:MAG: DUF2442 domain-containing protein, partial [Thermoguttaceae bacterium]